MNVRGAVGEKIESKDKKEKNNKIEPHTCVEGISNWRGNRFGAEICNLPSAGDLFASTRRDKMGWISP
jgi:hypothetical protein